MSTVYKTMPSPQPLPPIAPLARIRKRLVEAGVFGVVDRIAAQHDVPVAALLTVTGRVSQAQAALIRALGESMSPKDVAAALGWGEVAVRRELAVPEPPPTPAPPSGVRTKRARGRKPRSDVDTRLLALEAIVASYPPAEDRSLKQRLRVLEQKVGAILARVDALVSRVDPRSDLRDRITGEVAAAHKLTPQALIGRRRDAGVVAARRVLIQRLAAELGMSENAIGKFLGGRDHATIGCYLRGDHRARKKAA